MASGLLQPMTAFNSSLKDIPAIRYGTFTTTDTHLLQRAERGKPGTLYLPWEHLACPEAKDLIEATEIYWFSPGYPVSKGRTRLKARRTWQQEASRTKGQSPPGHRTQKMGANNEHPR